MLQEVTEHVYSVITGGMQIQNHVPEWSFNHLLIHIHHILPVSGKIRQEYFQERPLRHSFQKSKRSVRDEEFTASSFSYLLARCDGYVLKSD